MTKGKRLLEILIRDVNNRDEKKSDTTNISEWKADTKQRLFRTSGPNVKMQNKRRNCEWDLVFAI